MKTTREINHDILQLTTKIEETYPELNKYIEELYIEGRGTDAEELQNYHNSLDALLKNYAVSHRAQVQKNIILIIENNTELLENLTEYLELAGYIVLIAGNGRKGVELARKYYPDLIVCDIVMPDMDGYQVLHALLETAQTYEIPFIFSTANSERMDKETAMELGADDYIVKPYYVSDLVELAQTYIKCGSRRHKELIKYSTLL